MKEDQKELSKEEERLYYQKEREVLKKFILNKKNFLVLVSIFAIIVVLAIKNENKRHISDNDSSPEIVVDSSKVQEEEPKEETAEEKEEKINILSKSFGDSQIEFAGQKLKLKNFYNPENGVMSIYYSSDVLSYQPEHEIAIYQYENNIAISDLSEQEVLKMVGDFYRPVYIKKYFYNDSYFIVTSYSNDDFSSASLSLIKIFEKDGRTYKIVYEININDDVINAAQSWVNGGYAGLVDEFKDIDEFTKINLDYAKKVFNDSLKIKNNLSKTNIYSNIKFDVATIKENNAHANINLEYPKFKGLNRANDLNKIIEDIVLGALKNDRKDVNKWINDGALDDINNPCGGSSDYYYECSVNLTSSFKINSVINNIISIEIILTDYTGGGNGNHSYVETVIYDLKNKKRIFIDDLFCGDNYQDKVKEILKANLIVGPVFNNSADQLTDNVLFSNLEQASFGDLGITLSFDPYIFTAGSYGIYPVFIPYSLIENEACFKSGSAKKILIRRSLLNLEVPAKLSDSCGFMASDCDGFSFYGGKFNGLDEHDFTRDKPSISILFNDYKVGSLLNNKKTEQIVIVPYYWQWTSGGSSLYVLKIEGISLTPLARIDVGKRLPENLRIENNKIYFNSTNLDDSDNSKECYFKNNIIEENNLICQ